MYYRCLNACDVLYKVSLRHLLTWAWVKQFYLVPEAFWHDEIIQCHKVAGMSHPWHVVASRQWWQWWLSRPTCWPIPGQRIWREFQRAWNCNFDQLHQLDNWKNWWIGTENVLPLVPFQKSFWGKYWRRTLCQVLSPRLTVWLLQCEIVQLSLFYQALQWLWLDCEFEGESVNCAQFAR